MSVSFADVTAAWDRNPPNYTTGDTMTITVSGQAVYGGGDAATTEETWGPYDIPVMSASGNATISVGAAKVTRTTGGTIVKEDVFIDAAAGSTMTLGGRTFIVSADRRSVSAVA